MNHSSITIALANEDKTPYREYSFKKLQDKCKTAEVILPFDSHYQILVKNDNSVRIKLDIDVDGTIITGSGLIIPSNRHHYIERFIETAKKLYFTKKTNEKVADPTNKENGFLTVKVSKEKINYQPYTIWTYQPAKWDYINHHAFWNRGPWNTSDITYRSGGLSGSINCSSDAKSGDGSLKFNSDTYCNYSASIPSPSLDTGATVEGDESNQSFTTTNWLGEEEGSDFIFQFKMLGQEVKRSAQEEKDLMEYKRLKAKFEDK